MRYKFTGTFRDGAGNIVSGGTVSVFESGSTTPATIYETTTGTTEVNSTTSGADGVFTFYIMEGDYHADHTRKLVLSKSGFSSKTYDYMEPTDFYNGAFTQANIEEALTAIGTTNKATLLLRPGSWAITTPIAIPENVTLDMPPGSYFTISGTGAVTGLAYATPQMFGTGVGAVQQAFDSVRTGGTVEILPGDTVFSSAIARIEGMTVKGSGWDCVLKTNTVIDATLTVPVFKVTKSNITLKDFKLTWVTMPNAAQYLGTSGENQDTLVVGYNYNAFPTPPTMVSNVMVDHVYVHGGKQHGIWVGYSKNVTVQNCRVEEIYATGVNGWEAAELKILNNYVYRTMDAGMDFGSGFVETAVPGVYTQTWLADNIVIQGNTTVDTSVGIGSHGNRNITISNNTIDGTYGSAITSQPSDLYGITHSEGVVISGNTIKRPFQFYGNGNFHLLSYYATVGTPTPVIYVKSRANGTYGETGSGDVTISENTITDDLPVVESIYYHGLWAWGKNVNIVGNNFSFGFGSGLQLAFESPTAYDLIENLVIANNNITITEGNGYNMITLAGVARGSVTGNVFNVGGTGEASPKGRFVTVTYAKDILFTGNTITGVNTSGEDFVLNGNISDSSNIIMLPENNHGLLMGNHYTWYAVSTELADVGHIINTIGKYIGRRVWNNTTKKWVYAVGPAAADVWNDAVGTLAHSPT